jgi:hypothetical protein
MSVVVVILKRGKKLEAPKKMLEPLNLGDDLIITSAELFLALFRGSEKIAFS